MWRDPSLPSSLRLAWLAGLAGLAALWLLCAPAHAGAEALQVDDSATVALWPAVTLLRDPEGQLTLPQVQARAARFQRPAGTPGNLGRTSDVVWLRVPLHVAAGDGVSRVLEIDYPSLNRVDVHLLQQGRLLQQQRLGNELRFADRPLPTRTHAVLLALPAGDSELLLRVQTTSSMVLPMALRTPAAFTAQESRTQLLLGLISGVAVCMLAYSLFNGLALRDRLFADYAALLGGNLVFTLAYFGIGAQYLWPDSPQLSMQVAPLAVLVAVAAGAHFMRATLAVDELSRFSGRVLGAAGMAALASLGLALLGLIEYRLAQTLATVLGLTTTVAVLPVAYVRARRGERVAAYMLFGWAFYATGAITVACLLRGYLAPGFWTQYLYPLSMMVEMSAWMAVLSLRVQSIHRNADRARLESEALHALAHTDALTGLPNRRGLQMRLQAALPRASPQQLLAVFLLDLDGFKPINDRWGHDVGDALLVAVGRRLQAQLRSADVVARLGGDEFVVLAAGLADEGMARAVGQKMLAAFDTPFDAGGQTCKVGLTIGYALAPLDGSDGDELLKRADAAMYAGKQAGRHRLERGGRKAATA